MNRERIEKKNSYLVPPKRKLTEKEEKTTEGVEMK